MRLACHCAALLLLLGCVGCTQLDSNSQRGMAEDRSGIRTAPVRYTALGDSTGIGLGARSGGGYVDRLFAKIDQTHPNSHLVNLSVPWATTAHVLNKQVPSVSATRATLVSVSIGINDVLQGRSELEFEENYEQILSQLEKLDAVTVVVNLPDITAAPELLRSPDASIEVRVRSFNKRIETIANKRGLPLVDLYGLTRDSLRSRSEFFSADGMHPSDAGYQLWADAMWPTVRQSIER